MSRHIMVLLHPQREDSAVAAVSVWKALLDDGITPVVLDEEVLDLAARSSCPDVQQDLLSRCEVIDPAHPETAQLVPDCAQHSVLDVADNVELRRLLPLTVLT